MAERSLSAVSRGASQRPHDHVPADPRPATVPALFHRDDLAAHLLCSTRTLDRLDAAGKIPAGRRIGSRKVWVRLEIEEWIAQGCPARDAFEAARRGRK